MAFNDNKAFLNNLQIDNYEKLLLYFFAITHNV